MNSPIIFGKDLIDTKAIDQFLNCMGADYARDGALMADAHLGYSMPIGGVMDCADVVVPAYVGYDIGCGMQAVKTTYRPEVCRAHNRDILDSLKHCIPTGCNHHKGKSVASLMQEQLEYSSHWFQEWYHDNNGDTQLGTMGGNNHFIEMGVDRQGLVNIVVHSGSRGVGHKTATRYMQAAAGGKAREGNYPLDFQSEVGQDYWRDMNICLDFALENRRALIRQVSDIMLSLGFVGEVWYATAIDTVHNFAEYRFDMMEGGILRHRKGATAIHDNQQSVCAGNPAVGTFIVKGKKLRPFSLDSVSHGLGRTVSRKQAKATLSLEKMKYDMKGVAAECTERRLDEAPEAYKDWGAVMEAQRYLITVENQITPLLCVKG